MQTMYRCIVEFEDWRMATDKSLQPRTAEVERQLRQHPLLGTWDLERVRQYRIRYSEVLEYRRKSAPQAPLILVKHRLGIVPAERTQEHFEKEFRGLEAIWQRAGRKLEGTVPRPVAFLPDALAIVLEKLPGRNLERQMKIKANRVTGVLWAGKLRAIGLRFGVWLRLFHESTAQAPGIHDSKAYLAKISHWVDRCRASGLDESLARAVLEAAGRASDRVAGQPVPRAAFHGDLIPLNILVHHGHVAIVDFGGYRECEPTYEDLGFVLAYLGMMAQFGFYSPRAITAMTGGILTGYRPVESATLLNLYTLRGLLDIVACQFRAWRGVARKETRLQGMQKYLAAELHRLLEEPLADPADVLSQKFVTK